jgi:WD40 repeat protein
MSTCKCRVEYKGHNHTVWDVSVQQPSSTYFCTASLDKTLRLWNTEYAFPLRIFAGHNDSVDVSNNLVPLRIFAGHNDSVDVSCNLVPLRIFAGHNDSVDVSNNLVPLRIFAGHNDSVDVSCNLVPEGYPPTRSPSLSLHQKDPETDRL